MKKSTLALFTAFLVFSAHADILTADQAMPDQPVIQKNANQVIKEEVKNIDFTDFNFSPAQAFNLESKNSYKLSIGINGSNVPVEPRTKNFTDIQEQNVDSITTYYGNIIGNCRNGQSINRKILEEYQNHYSENQKELNAILFDIAKGQYSDANLLSVEMLLRSELESYRCVFMGAAINIVENQDFVTSVNENISNIQKRNYILRNTFDSIRYLYLGVNNETIIKNRIF